MMLPMCELNVDSDCSIDCSSPMSAKTASKTGRRESASAGTGSPACAISASRPTVFSATVLPPVFGPGDEQDTLKSLRPPDVGEPARLRAARAEPDGDWHDVALEQRMTRVLAGRARPARRAATAGLGVPGRAEVPSRRSPRRDAPSPASRSISASASMASPISSSRSPTRRRELAEDARNLPLLLRQHLAPLFPISTVSSGSRNTVAPDDETSCTMPGSCARCSAFTGMT